MNNRTMQSPQVLPIKYYRLHWLEENGLTCKGIAPRLGVCGSRVSTIMSQGKATKAQISILKDVFKMPEELLPLPSREKPGPMSAQERAELTTQEVCPC